MMVRAWMLAALALVAQGTPQAPPETNAPSLRIIAPADDSYVSGTVHLQAAIAPLAALREIAGITFYVDGRFVCRLEREPFECDWDVGETVIDHQIRVVAMLAGGGRLVATVHTKKLDHAETVNVDVVQITATVTDVHDRFVGGLKRSDFHVFEDEKPQAITSFLAENVPLEILAAIDVSGSMRPSMEEVKAAVKEFLTDVPERHQVTLLGFNDNIFPLARRATDKATRLRAVDRLAAWGATSLYDVIIRGMDTLDRVTGRKALIVFTDGEDQGSQSTPDDVVQRLEQTDATLYTIGLGIRSSVPELRRLMERLARQSGGRAFFPTQVEDLRQVFREILEDVSNQYLVSYAPSNIARDGTWRKIKVEVAGDYHVRAREGYRAKTAR